MCVSIETVSIVGSFISASIIAIYAIKSHNLANELKRMHLVNNEKEQLFRKQLNDLYQAIVIATLQSSNTDWKQLRNFINEFNKYYNGETKIFKESDGDALR